MDRRLVAWVVVAVGAVLLAVSALADSLGIGDEEGFGWKQTTGVVVGQRLSSAASRGCTCLGAARSSPAPRSDASGARRRLTPDGHVSRSGAPGVRGADGLVHEVRARPGGPRSSSAPAAPTPISCSWERRPGSTRTSRECRSLARRGSCSTGCSKASVSRGPTSSSRTCSVPSSGEPRPAAGGDRRASRTSSGRSS